MSKNLSNININEEKNKSIQQNRIFNFEIDILKSKIAKKKNEIYSLRLIY